MICRALEFTSPDQRRAVKQGKEVEKIRGEYYNKPRRKEIANLDKNQLWAYEESLKVYRDLKGVIDTSFENGKLEGKEEGKIEERIQVAKRAHQQGMSIDNIATLTNLTPVEIKEILGL